MLSSSAATAAGARFRLFRRFSSSLLSNPSIPNPPIDLPSTLQLTQSSFLYALKKLDKMPQRALDLFNRYNTSSFDPGAPAYNLMLRILAGPNHLSDLWALLKSMKDAGYVLDHGTYGTLLASFRCNKLPSEASVIAKFYSDSLANAKQSDFIKEAAKILKSSEEWNDEVEMKLNGVRLNLSDDVVARVIWEIRESPTKVLSFFRWTGRNNHDYEYGAVAYNALARLLAKEESVEKFWSIVDEMKSKGHDVDIDTYVKVSRNFQKSKMMKEAVELYERMMDGPYKPAIQDCGVLLRQISLAPEPDLELVNRVVNKYEAAGYTLSKVVYDGIHRSLTRKAKFDEADDILNKMRQAGYEPDNITYSQLVSGLCKANKLDDACWILDEMEEVGCIPDVKTWTVLIQGHCATGAMSKALECLTKMLEKGCDADADLLDVLVKGFCSGNRVDGAYTLVTEMVERTRLRPWQATYKYLIQELLQRKKLEEALKLLDMMKIHKFPPFADPFPTYISKFGTTEDAKEFLRALTINQYPSSTAYLHVFKSFFKEGRYTEAKDLLFKCPHHIRKHADIAKLFGSSKAAKTISL